MPTIPELPAASATTDESELAVIYKNGTTYKAVLADILALRQQANAILTSLSGLGAGVGFLQKTGPTTFVTTYIPGAGAYDPLGTAQAINDAHNIDTGAHAAAGFAKLGVAQTWTAAQQFDAGTPTVPGLSIGSTSYGLSLDGTAISMAIAGIPRLRFAGTLNTQDNYGNYTVLAIRRANGTYAAPTKILSGNLLGQYMFRGAYDVAGVGTFDSSGPYIRGVATEDYNGSGTKGAYLSIAAITTGSGSATESLRIAGDLVSTPVPLSVTGSITAQAAATQDAIILAGRAGGTSSYSVTLTPLALSANRTISIQNANQTLAGIDVGQTWTVAQTFRAANAIRVEAASTQDAIVLAGRAGGTSSYSVTIVPTTLTASRTLTLPDANVTLPSTFVSLGVANTWTAVQTFRVANGARFEEAATQDAIVVKGRAGGTSNYTAYLAPTTLTASRNAYLPDADTVLAGLSLAQTFLAAQTFRAANAIRVEAASTQDAIILAGRAGGSGSYAATIVPGTMSGSVGITLPVASTVLAGLSIAQTWTAAQTFRAANAIRVEAASTQDAIILAGGAGGTSSYAVTLTPGTLAASYTLTLPNVTSTIAALGLDQTWTADQTFRNTGGTRFEYGSGLDSIVIAPRNGGSSSYAVMLVTAALGGNRTLTLPDAAGSVAVIKASPPASATAAGTPWTIAIDTNYLYVCTALNTWTRVALATW